MILQSVAITSAASGSQAVIAAVTNKRILVYRFYLTNAVATAQAFTLLDGATALTGAIALPTSVGGFVGFQDTYDNCPIFITSAGNAFNISLANATATAGYCQYTVL
jgi:hypothetical protein